MLGFLFLFLIFVMGVNLCLCCKEDSDDENEVNIENDISNIKNINDNNNNYPVINNIIQIPKNNEKNENIKESNKLIEQGKNNKNENENIKERNKLIEQEKNNKNENEIVKESNKLIEQGKNNKNENENEIIEESTKFIEYEKSNKIENNVFENENSQILIYDNENKEKKNNLEQNSINVIKKQLEVIDEKNSLEENEEKKIKLFGLYNPRFNCYLNSSLQSFFHLDRFNSFIKQYEFNNNCRLTNEYLNLLNQIELGKKELDPRGIKKILSEEEEKYKYNNQEDANEFISLFLNEMMKEVKGIGIENIEKIDSPKDEMTKVIFDKFERRFFGKNQSFLTDLFYGRYKIDIYCPNNHLIKVNFQRYNMIDIPSNNINSSIEDLLKKYQEKKIINSQIYCNECGLIDKYYSKTIIYSLPYYIILFLDNPIKKLEKINLEVNKFFEGEKKNNDIYELISVIGYSGNFKSGHYIAKCKISEDKWYEFSDSYFHPINNSSIVNDRDVILFYQKK